MILSGAEGDGAALAMRLVVRAAEALDADRLIPITRAHVDSCLYHGEATVDFVERLVDGGAHVAVPTTLNVGEVDLILAVGAAVAEELYGRQIPIVQLAPAELGGIADGAQIRVAGAEVTLL